MSVPLTPAPHLSRRAPNQASVLGSSVLPLTSVSGSHLFWFLLVPFLWQTLSLVSFFVVERSLILQPGVILNFYPSFPSVKP